MAIILWLMSVLNISITKETDFHLISRDLWDTFPQPQLNLKTLPSYEIIDSEAGKGFFESYEQQI